MKFKGIRGKNALSWSETKPSGVPKTASLWSAGRTRATWYLSSNTVKNSIFPFSYSCKYLHPATAEPKAAPAAVSLRVGCGQSLDSEAVTLDWKDGFYQLILIRAMTTSLLWGKSYFNIKECLTPLPALTRPDTNSLHTKVTSPSPCSLVHMHVLCMYRLLTQY